MIWPISYFQQRARRRAIRELFREVRSYHLHIKPSYERDGYGIFSLGWWKYVVKKRDGFDNSWDVVERFATISAATKHMQQAIAKAGEAARTQTDLGYASLR